MQPGFALAPFPFWVIKLFLKASNTHCIFSFFSSSLEYNKDLKLLLWHESQAIAVTNSNTYSESLTQWVSVPRGHYGVSAISTSNIKRLEERKINPVSFSQQLSNDIWHFYSTKTSLRAGSQRFEGWSRHTLHRALCYDCLFILRTQLEYSH